MRITGNYEATSRGADFFFFLPASFLLLNAGDGACPGRSLQDSEERRSPGRVAPAGVRWELRVPATSWSYCCSRTQTPEHPAGDRPPSSSVGPAPAEPRPSSALSEHGAKVRGDLGHQIPHDYFLQETFLKYLIPICLLRNVLSLQVHTHTQATGTHVQHAHTHGDTKQVSRRDKTLPKVFLDREMSLGSIYQRCADAETDRHC